MHKFKRTTIFPVSKNQKVFFYPVIVAFFLGCIVAWLSLTYFLIGKYHKPIQEDRIFMFLDMKSSTTIAEKIGHVKYFEMLREYYSDLSNPIVQYHGEVYQYV